MVIFDRYDVVFAEIPNEVSLAFTLTGCPNNCEGCHSPHLRNSTGTELTEYLLIEILKEYSSSITTVLFLGGDAYQDKLIPLLRVARAKGLKTALYSGFDEINCNLTSFLDYYKIGRYVHELGGLDSDTTNQRLYKLPEKKDVTHLLRR